MPRTQASGRTATTTRTNVFNQTSSFFFGGVNCQASLASATGVSGLTSSICVGGWFKQNPVKNVSGSGFPAAYNIGGTSGPFSYMNTVGSPGRATLNAHLVINGVLSDGNVGSGSPTPSNTWYHYVFDYDGATLISYRNGVLVGSTPKSGAVTLTDNSITIGSQLGANRFWGAVCQFFVAPHLTAAQIASIAQNNTYPSGLVGLYLMNEGTGTTLNDTSGNGNNLTITGTGVWSTDVPAQTRGVASGRAVAV